MLRILEHLLSTSERTSMVPIASLLICVCACKLASSTWLIKFTSSSQVVIVKKTLEWKHSRNIFLSVLEPFTHEDELLDLLESPFGKCIGKLYFEGASTLSRIS